MTFVTDKILTEDELIDFVFEQTVKRLELGTPIHDKYPQATNIIFWIDDEYRVFTREEYDRLRCHLMQFVIDSKLEWNIDNF